MKKVLIFLMISNLTLAQEISSYLGLNLGVHSSKGTTQEQNKSGTSFNGKIVGSYNLEQSYIDFGLGYQYMELTAKGVKVTTKSISVDGEYRYKLTNKWSVGPNVRLVGGTDNTNSENIGGDSITTHALIKAMYQTKLNNNDFRVELGVGSTLNLDRNLTTAMVGVQFELPWKYKVNSKSNQEFADLKVDLKMAQVKFGSDKFELSLKDESKLKRLAQFLRDNNKEWSRIKISGHTDITGDSLYNKALSQDRADSVMKVFIKEGVNEVKMTAHGFGSSRPLNSANTEQAWSENRRTEVEFYGISNRSWFNQKIMEILK